MKAVILCLFVLFFCITGKTQQSGQMLAYSTNGNIIDPDWKAKVVATDSWKGGNEVTGSIFFNDEMNKGYVVLTNGKTTRDILLRYNVYSQEINFMEDKKEMVLDATTPVREFGYSFFADNEQKNVVFRAGYPSVGKNNAASFYQVVADGDISLLKYMTKHIMEKTDNRGAAEKVIIDSDTWFIYNKADNSINELKRNKAGLMAALPKYAGYIETIAAERGFRLKTDADWQVLLNRLALYKL